MFNTLRYAKILEESGFSRDQAETSIKILVEIMEDKLATKQDLSELGLAMKQDIAEVRQELKRDILDLRHETKKDHLELKHELTLRLGAMITAGIGILAALHKFT